MKNIEIKTACPPLHELYPKLKVLGASHVWTHRQRDTFFHVPEGYLKLRVVEGEPGELIAYSREVGIHPRPSNYEIAVIPDPDVLEVVLTRSLGIRGVVEKTRELHLWQHTRIHLDEVVGLGSFLELEAVAREISLEAAETEAETVIERLGLTRSEFLDRPYLEFLEARAAAGSPR
jgi:predicted adenylyl cyclase CyaB